jgi:hypothetical protein
MLRCPSGNRLPTNQHLRNLLLVLENSHVGQGITRDHNDVGKLLRCDGSNIPLQTRAFSSYPGRRADRLKRGETRFSQFLQLACALAVSGDDSRV